MLRIEDVTYPVRDHDEAIAFFVDVLGFMLREDATHGGWRRVVVAPPGDPGDGAAAPTGLVLALASDDTLRRRAADDVGWFLATDDFAAQRARMLAHGVRFLEEPRHEPYGTVAVFADPSGLLWDLVQRPDPAA